ncbi:hypothetical protein Adu01nite_85350 [Paractinoplanes durhamensis]|uniref:DUF2399 domain-containing protein n=2 Tax=Paractinoplanes durhamensis TaxID=113563 RepID=A0ABQ3ZBJ2_9ACTN|nr:hypothetical protein Adu01nite_85350 [Actinoplanes durhamensis]
MRRPLALLTAVVGPPRVRLAYHGDFDWPGTAIADRVMARFGAEPWRFRAGDYRRAVARAQALGTPGQALVGRVAETRWDPELAEAMLKSGIAIHEEAVIGEFLPDLVQQPVMRSAARTFSSRRSSTTSGTSAKTTAAPG